jgi:Sap, sulfolipid-1-addressing protein
VHEAAHIALYGLVAALSPTVLLATLVVLGSGRGRVNGIVFAAAFLLGQTVTFLLAFLVGTAVTPDDGGPSHIEEALELTAGVMLLVVAAQRHSSRRAPRAAGTPRSEALFARLADVKPVVSFGIGLPLGVGAKRLIISILAATTIAVDTLTSAENLALSVFYIALASIVVWAPVVLYLVFGTRADGLTTETRQWIVSHEDAVTTFSALVLGVLLVGDGLLSLLV